MEGFIYMVSWAETIIIALAGALYLLIVFHFVNDEEGDEGDEDVKVINGEKWVKKE